MESKGQKDIETRLKEALLEVQALQNENQMLQDDLEDCRDQLFDLLQKGNDIPEREVKDSYLSVFSGVETWIDEISTDDDFEASFKAQFQRNMQRDDRRQLFATLGLGPHREWQEELGNSEACYYVVLSLAISQCITQGIFRLRGISDWEGVIYPLGIEDAHIDWLMEIQKTMSDVLRRDQMQIARWRSEAIYAMTATRSFEKRLNESSKDLLIKLHSMISLWIGKELSPEHLRSLRTTVIERATDMLLLICRSGKSYKLENGSDSRGSVTSEVFFESSPGPVKDIASWKTLTPDQVTGTFHCIYPSLIRQSLPGERDLELVKPIFLGYQSAQLRHHRSGTQSPANRSPSPRKRESRKPHRETSDAKASRPSKEQRQPKTEEGILDRAAAYNIRVPQPARSRDFLSSLRSLVRPRSPPRHAATFPTRHTSSVSTSASQEQATAISSHYEPPNHPVHQCEEYRNVQFSRALSVGTESRQQNSLLVQVYEHPDPSLLTYRKSDSEPVHPGTGPSNSRRHRRSSSFSQ